MNLQRSLMGCCGIIGLYSMGHTTNTNFLPEFFRKYSNLQHLPNNEVKSYVKRNYNKNNRLVGGSNIIVFLAHYQFNALEVLKSFGFKVINTDNNSNSGNNVLTLSCSTEHMDKVIKDWIWGEEKTKNKDKKIKELRRLRDNARNRMYYYRSKPVRGPALLEAEAAYTGYVQQIRELTND